MLLIIMSTFGCKPDPLEYARPSDLAGTIYTQLESMGNFNYYLQCLDKTEYKEPLVKGGSWTVFAPTDEAFEKFMQEEGYTTVDDIPSSRLLHLVQYSIIISGWNTTTLTYGVNNTGFYAGSNFKRDTQYRDTIVEINTADYNLHPTENKFPDGVYKVAESYLRIKPTAFFLQPYFDAKPRFQTSDYSFLFPGETFTENGMKVFDANVSQTNVVAENGMIYALDKVIEPRKTQYQNLTSEEYGEKYTTFKRLLERFAFLKERGDVVNEVTGETETIYNLLFSTGITLNNLPFNPYDESYPKLLNNVDRTLANGTGLAVPTNDALEQYLLGDSILGQFYSSYDDMPLDVLGKFLSTFFFTDFWDLCPSNQGSEVLNVGLNPVNYKIEDVVDQKFCSNGFFVGVNKVYENANFSTILGPLLLDPEYTIMLKAVQDAEIDNALQSVSTQFSIFGIKNDQFIDIKDPNSATRTITVVDYLPDLSVIQIEVKENGVVDRLYPLDMNSPTSADVSYVTTTLQDIVLNQIVEANVDLTDNNYYQTKSGEFIYGSQGNQVAGGGDISRNDPALVVSVRDTDNGKFYDMSHAIERPLVFTYGALVENSTTFSRFIEVLTAADALVAIPNVSDDKLISFLNLSRTFTLLAPNNSAIEQAIADGVILDPNNLSGLTPLELAIAKQDLLNFAKKHFIQQAIATNGITAGTFSSMYFGKVIDFVPVYDQFLFENSHVPSNLTVKNATTGAVITETGALTNILSNRVVIHEIENYLK
ncbi:fasciclin domain-containing protein [Mariniflexile fucanivorans]|nr:fasciclin domain-containing protein [Mariniflexile fucanivorans]